MFAAGVPGRLIARWRRRATRAVPAVAALALLTASACANQAAYQSAQTPELTSVALAEPFSTHITHTGGSGVALRTACREDARLSGVGLAEESLISVTDVGVGSCLGWYVLGSEHESTWIRGEYLADHPPAPPVGVAQGADAISVGTRWLSGWVTTVDGLNATVSRTPRLLASLLSGVAATTAAVAWWLFARRRRQSAAKQPRAVDAESSLDALIRHGRVDVAFQPIWSLPLRSLIAYEALARPSRSLWPEEVENVFKLAERSGRAFDLDLICLRSALVKGRDLPPGLRLFLNISPATVLDPRFSSTQLAQEAITSGVHPSHVVIEITERATIPMSALNGVCSDLRREGFQIALDDAGAGNAGLEMMRHVQFQYVKVDRAVTAGATNEKGGSAVLDALLSYAEHSGATVIFEGIETPAMLNLVEGLAVRSDTAIPQYAGQGYLLGVPSAWLPSAAA